MNERPRNPNLYYQVPPASAESDFSPKKTLFILVIVVGCFAVLWPKVLHPMLIGNASQQIRPNQMDKASGCCDVISEKDINTIKIMTEICGSITQKLDEGQLPQKIMLAKCQQEIFATCGIDLSDVLKEKVALGANVKQILTELRSLNGSLCLKHNFGVNPWQLGVPHRITLKLTDNVRQERSANVKPEMVHPAFRERGRAIPQSQGYSPSRPPPRIVEGRPGPIPGMRPTIGGAGHVTPPPKQGAGSMGIIMPIYTIGIVIFFTYTLMKVVFKKQPTGPGGNLYSEIEADLNFRKEVFETQQKYRLQKEANGSKLVVNAMSALLEEVDLELETRRKMNELQQQLEQPLGNGGLSNGQLKKDEPSVKIMGMETSASCENGTKWNRAESPILEVKKTNPVVEPPKEIYLEGPLTSQSQILVSDSNIETENIKNNGGDPAVVLAGKMTLSVINFDGDETANDNKKTLNDDENREICEEIDNIIELALDDVNTAQENTKTVNEVVQNTNEEENKKVINKTKEQEINKNEEENNESEEEEEEEEYEEEEDEEINEINEDSDEDIQENEIRGTVENGHDNHEIAVVSAEQNDTSEEEDDEEVEDDEEEVEEIIEEYEEEESDEEEKVVENSHPKQNGAH